MEDVKVLQEQVRRFDEFGYREGKPLSARRLVDLFARPTEFFRSQIAIGKTPYVLAVTWVVGISGSMDRIDKQLMKMEYSTHPQSAEFLAKIADSWLSFWPFVVVVGGIGAFFLWVMGGWWYNVRLKWCGAVDHDTHSGRVVYIYTSFIYALPSVILVLAQTFLYPDYRSAYNSDSYLSMLLLIFLFWAVVNSYRAVGVVFDVHGGRRKLWFLILPIISYMLAFGVLTTILGVLGAQR